MKYRYLVLGICLGCLFLACKPDFELNAPYKDVTVVYGILDYQDSVHYVKIYKGFQSHQVFIDAKNPDSIYYYDKINVVLQEYNKNMLIREFPLKMVSNEIPKDDGFFYSGDAKVLYKTTEKIKPECSYKIKITNKITGKITEGSTPIVNELNIRGPSIIDMTRTSTITFEYATFASDSCYEFMVSFHYFEVDKATKKVTRKKISKYVSKAGDRYVTNPDGYSSHKFAATFFDDLAEQLKPNAAVTRYWGSPEGDPSDQKPVEIIGWAGGTSMKNYLLSNKPTSSFVQVNTIYTNLKVVPKADGTTDGLAFGFFSSKVKSRPFQCLVSAQSHSQDSLVLGTKTRHLGFRYRDEYHP